MAPYFTIKDGEAVPVDQLPDLSGLKSNLDGLCYCSSEETLPDGSVKKTNVFVHKGFIEV